MDERVSMKVQEAQKRINNFEEVELGFREEDALSESSRCLNCKVPKCVSGCPVNIRIPDFINEIKNNNIKKAYEIICEASSLGSICGRVCPQESQCEKMCIKGIKGQSISIGSLERYVCDKANESNYSTSNMKKKNGKSVAIVGSGPAGLACAYDLAKEGFSVTIYEVLHSPGGVLTYGIPEFRLPKRVVKKEIDKLISLGVNIKTDYMIGKTLTIDDLLKEYDRVFISSGAGVPKFMGIEGEEANEVFSANEVLTRINLMKSYKDESKTPIKKGSVAYVIGGGNVAMDAVRSLKRLGIEAHIMYRRSENELPARKVEVQHAKEEGIIFDTLKNPVKIIKNEENSVVGIEVVDMKLTKEDENGRKCVEEITNSNHILKCDMVVMALGTLPNKEAIFSSDIKIDEKGLIIVNDSKTNNDKVYAGGDCVSGSATVILAMSAGRGAAKKIIESF